MNLSETAARRGVWVVLAVLALGSGPACAPTSEPTRRAPVRVRAEEAPAPGPTTKPAPAIPMH